MRRAESFGISFRGGIFFTGRRFHVSVCVGALDLAPLSLRPAHGLRVEVPAATGDCEHRGYGADCGVESLTAVLSSRFSVPSCHLGLPRTENRELRTCK